ncbi:T cell receptor beta chain MC.7.G5-like [Epinephelus moara]|uniref:T cell receptor beta chain MC.7.G5-like n=1 Tax=Epinephelus moara TaxID=300413 RepID=UPI00214E4E3B|nr:T cell receptor beta chain MC.7.G5-like [Epinephelus moara]
MSSSMQTFGFLFICFYCQVNAVVFQQFPPQIVKEDTVVQIKCSHNDNTLLSMLWYQQKDNMSMTLIGYGYGTSPPNYEDEFDKEFELTREDTVTGALVVRKAKLSHSAVYFCAASSTFCVKITQPPFIFSREGDSAVTLQCEQDDDQYYNMYWYIQSGGANMQLVTYSTSKDTASTEAPFNKSSYTMFRPEMLQSSLQIKSMEAGDSAVYYCASTVTEIAAVRLELLHPSVSPTCTAALSHTHTEMEAEIWRSGVGEGERREAKRHENTVTYTEPAYFGQGTKLTVLEENLQITPPTVKVLPPSEKECKNKRGNAEKTIVCLASGFYPDHVSVSWQVGGEDVTTGVATDNAALRRKNKTYTITSRLRVSAKEWYNPDTEFKCTVSFYNGTDTEYNSDSISGDKAKEGVLTREKYLKITQTAKLSYGVFIVKSMVYGVFVAFLVWKLRNSSGKRNH